MRTCEPSPERGPFVPPSSRTPGIPIANWSTLGNQRFGHPHQAQIRDIFHGFDSVRIRVAPLGPSRENPGKPQEETDTRHSPVRHLAAGPPLSRVLSGDPLRVRCPRAQPGPLLVAVPESQLGTTIIAISWVATWRPPAASQNLPRPYLGLWPRNVPQQPPEQVFRSPTTTTTPSSDCFIATRSESWRRAACGLEGRTCLPGHPLSLAQHYSLLPSAVALSARWALPGSFLTTSLALASASPTSVKEDWSKTRLKGGECPCS